MNKKYRVALTDQERASLGRRIASGTAPAYDLLHTRILLKAERNGTANLFLVTEPLRGWRHVEVTERRTKLDWARVVKDLVDVRYPEDDRIVLVMDNLNTHTPAALYEAFPPAEARRIVERLEIHYTPKHGSWLNVAETELSTMSGQCLHRRIPDCETLERRSRRGRPSGTLSVDLSTGGSRPRTPASN